MTDYIAFVAGTAHKTRGTIYGMGRSADAALADARFWSENDGMSVAQATDELIRKIENNGGDVRWFLDADGVAQADA